MFSSLFVGVDLFSPLGAPFRFIAQPFCDCNTRSDTMIVREIINVLSASLAATAVTNFARKID